jgi:hypothetical protein
MSGVKRTVDLHALKTRDLVIQNSDNTFPPAGGLLVAADDRGRMIVTDNISVDDLQLNNRSLADASGSIAASTLTLTTTGTAIETAGDIYVNNANIYTSGDQYSTGYVETNTLVLLDLSANNQRTRLYVESGVDVLSQKLIWKNDATGAVININQCLDNLKVDPEPAYNNIPQLKNNIDPNIHRYINLLLTLFNQRKIFLALA